MTSTLDSTRNKRRELSTLLEQFYYSDDGTVGHCSKEGGDFITTADASGKNEAEDDKADDNVNGVNDALNDSDPIESNNDNTTNNNVTCPQHQIKQRNGRCPLCAATQRRRRSYDSLCDDNDETGTRNNRQEKGEILHHRLQPRRSSRFVDGLASQVRHCEEARQ